jgi:hypothetical protein
MLHHVLMISNNVLICAGNDHASTKSTNISVYFKAEITKKY